jgi:hypothetical protein
MKKLLYLCLILAGCTSPRGEIRETISLAGAWDFRVDSLDTGLTEKWYAGSFDEPIELPGSMAENGKGDEVTLGTEWTGNIIDSSYFRDEKYRKYRQPGQVKIPFWLKPVRHYMGPAWYQKEISLPDDWQGRRVVLSLERCHWESRLFVNGREAGRRSSLAVPHTYDVTAWLKPGVNRFSIRIDNRMIVPVGVNAHSVSDHTQSNWNGIVGEMVLQAGSPVFISDVQIYPEVSSKTARVAITLDKPMGEPVEGLVEIQAACFNSEISHRPGRFSREVILNEASQTFMVDYPMGDRVQLWSEFSPALYRVEVKLKDPGGRVLDLQDETFGMREFRARGTRFEVNGHPVFLRGTLECCIFPMTGYPPTDVASWEHVLKRCQAHGLNHIRFHSWCPPEAAFEAADRLGIYFQVECSSWANQGSTLGDGSPIDDFIYAEGDRIMQAYGNHPSLCMMAYGNEPGGENHEPFLKGLLDYWKLKDKRRVYTAGAGWPLLPENEYHNGPQPRIQQWGEGLESSINAAPPQTTSDYRDIISRYEIPFVSHEIGQWCVYPDFREIEKYTGVLRATNFEIFRETLEQNHMGDQAEDFLMASGKLQALCYKAEIEEALRTPGFAGFQLLQLHDFPGQGTALVGVLDPFFDSKPYIGPEAFRMFCSQTVPLARLEKRIFTNNETFHAGIEMAHFGMNPIPELELVCRVMNASGETLHEAVLEKDEVPVDNAIHLGYMDFDLQGISQAQKLTLQVSAEGTNISNNWDFWVYPADIEPWPGKVHITDRLDAKAEAILADGGSVLLLCFGKVREDMGGEVAIGFSSIFWNTAWTAGQAPHTLGILVDPDHPLFGDFPTEYHSNWQWWDPVSHSQAMILDHFPASLKPLIQPIDTWFENRRLALAFEAATGGGKLLVCSIDLEADLTERTVSRQLLQSMLQYMNSEVFNPGVQLEPDQIRKMIAHFPPPDAAGG